MPICGRERVPLSSGSSQEAGAGAYDPSQGWVAHAWMAPLDRRVSHVSAHALLTSWGNRPAVAGKRFSSFFIIHVSGEGDALG
eukprot:902356-Prymnesium_polylepis.1